MRGTRNGRGESHSAMGGARWAWIIVIGLAAGLAAHRLSTDVGGDAASAADGSSKPVAANVEPALQSREVSTRCGRHVRYWKAGSQRRIPASRQRESRRSVRVTHRGRTKASDQPRRVRNSIRSGAPARPNRRRDRLWRPGGYRAPPPVRRRTCAWPKMLDDSVAPERVLALDIGTQVRGK